MERREAMNEKWMASVAGASMRSRRGFALIDLIVVCAVLGIAATLFISVSTRARDGARGRSCLDNVKYLSVAFRMYREDYDGVFPSAKIGGVRTVKASENPWTLKPLVGWQDALMASTKNSSNFFCPATKGLKDIDPTKPNSTNFFFNGNLSALPYAKLKTPTKIVLLGDGNDGREVANGTYHKTSLPEAWRNDYNSPCYRHLWGANYAFADGHAKWLKPDAIAPAPGAPYTFSIR